MFCTQCGANSPEGARFCASCGKAMSRVEPTMAAGKPEAAPTKGQADFQNTFPGATPKKASPTARAAAASTPGFGSHSPEPAEDQEAWAAYIGPKNRDYYLQRFERYSKGNGALWHWPALLVSWYWLLYRKMWPQAALYFVGIFVMSFVLGMITSVNEDAGGIAGLAMLAGFFIVPAMLANGMYWRRSLKVMGRLRAITSSRDQYLGALSVKGGTSNLAIVFVIVGAIFFFGIMAAIALPAYNDYTKRAKASEVMIHGNATAQSVAEHYQANNVVATDLNVLGVAPINLTGVTISISPEDGTVTYQVRDLGTMKFQPTIDENGKIGVECSSPDMRAPILPIRCRK